MSWAEGVQVAVVVLVAASLALFTLERRQTPKVEERTVAAIFSNPYLRILTILLMVLIVLRAEDAPSSLTWLPAIVVLIIGTTVAGADFILLLVALLKNNETFIRQHYALERERFRATTQVVPKPTETIIAPPVTETLAPEQALEPILRGLAAIRIQEAHMAATPVAEPRVAVISTGAPEALVKHPAFGGRLERTYVPEGTVISEGIGAAAVGFVAAIAPTAKILPITVFSASFTGTAEWIREGVEAALAWAPDVVLLDFGGTQPLEPVRDLIRRHSAMVVLIAPAGNEGASSPSWPASEANVLGVAATAARVGLAPFSSYGRGVRVAAPGVDVVSLVGVHDNQLAFAQMSGTSIAAGIVTGVAALALSLVKLPPRDIAEAIEETGEPLPGRRSLRLTDAAALVERLAPDGVVAGEVAPGSGRG